MTTFTRISTDETPSIYTSPDQVISDISPLIYGGFTEYGFSMLDDFSN
jgi:alpha-N-arabinofuranosidase